MGHVIVQIYEVQDPEEAGALIELGVDHIGSVLMSLDDPRNGQLERTMSFVASCGKKSSLIPLMTDVDMICRAMDRFRPHIVHFCEVLTGNCAGGEKGAAFQRQEDVRKRFPEVSIMRSIPIAPPGLSDRVPTLEIARMFEPISDYFLTDTLMMPNDGGIDSAQPVSGFVGITGKTCDWEMAGRLVAASGIPVILAGGISPENVSDGICRVGPAGVDSCTLTNATDAKGRPIRFRKDLEKVKRLVAAARENDETTENMPSE